jgi:lysophospholipase L1-like esterase
MTPRSTTLSTLCLCLLTAAIACGMACGGKSPSAPTPPTTPTPPSTPPVDPQPPTTPAPPPPPPTLRYTNFVAFGDSLTEGVVSPAPTVMVKLLAAQAYPALLQGLLTGRYTAQTISVLNRGKAGEQAVDGLPRFVDVLRQDRPQVAIVLEGFNDISSYGNRGLGNAVGAIESMLKEARSRGVIVLLATLPPERPGAQKTLSSSQYNEFNKQVVATGQDEGAQIIDLSRELSLSAIGQDGVHLTEAGYQEMANIFFTHIQALYDQPAQPTAAPKPTPTATAPNATH